MKTGYVIKDELSGQFYTAKAPASQFTPDINSAKVLDKEAFARAIVNNRNNWVHARFMGDHLPSSERWVQTRLVIIPVTVEVKPIE